MVEIFIGGRLNNFFANLLILISRNISPQFKGNANELFAEDRSGGIAPNPRNRYHRGISLLFSVSDAESTDGNMIGGSVANPTFPFSRKIAIASLLKREGNMRWK